VKGKRLLSIVVPVMLILAMVMVSACTGKTTKTTTTMPTTTTVTTLTTTTTVAMPTPVMDTPVVTFTNNLNGATNVPINTKVGAFFTEAIDPLTITSTTFTLMQGATGPQSYLHNHSASLGTHKAVTIKMS
jgi:Bacterial Ig-like domain